MGKAVQGINPEVLRWARERAGYSVEDIAESFKRDPDVVLAWESGKAAPTYPQLERLAHQLYKRPIAVFFFPEPPDEPPPSSSFRTLPVPEIQALSTDTLYTIRQAAAMQITLSEVSGGTNPSERKIFADLVAKPSAPALAARTVREYLRLDLSTQFGWTSTKEALKNWRALIAEHGVFVFKRAIKQDDISGFSLMDSEFPVIYLNNGSAMARQIFTLFHELAHILVDTSGVAKVDDSYIDDLKGHPKEIEVFCNKFASEFLVPNRDFERHLEPGRFDDQYLTSLATHYRVSHEVILRKLLDRGEVTPDFYKKMAAQWNKEYKDHKESKKKRSSGGDYYATQATYLGEKFLKLAFTKYYEGRYTLEQLADYLNVKPKNVTGLEEFMLRKAAG